MKAKQFYNLTAWKYFSKCVKLSRIRKDGLVQCVTSGRLYEPTDRNLIAGHFIKVFDGNSTNFSVAFEIANCWPQSARDNRYFGGKPEVMQGIIASIYGEKKIHDLRIKSNFPMKLDKFTCDQLRIYWKKEFERLVEEKGINPWK